MLCINLSEYWTTLTLKMELNGTEITREIFRKLISEMLTTQPKIPKIVKASRTTEIFGKKFSKIGETSRGCPFFRKLRKIRFHSLLEISENSKQNFCSNGKPLVIQGNHLMVT